MAKTLNQLQQELDGLHKKLVLPTGADFGNRNLKLSVDPLDGRGPLSISIPAVYSKDEPLGIFDEKNQYYKPTTAFKMESCGLDLWFGQDVLGNKNLNGNSELDELKYYDHKHLRLLFKAAYKMLSSKNDDLENRRLLIDTSMPPGPYRTKPEIRKAAVLAYKKVFGKPADTGNKMVSLTGNHTLGKGFNLTTTFNNLQPEGINFINSYRHRNKTIDNDPVFVIDIGLGTTEYIYFPKGSYTPEKNDGVITVNLHGLVNGFGFLNRGAVELDILRGRGDANWPDTLLTHYKNIYDFVVTYRRNKNGNRFEKLAIIGGGGVLMNRSKKIKELFSRLGQVHYGNEFINSIGNLEAVRPECEKRNAEILSKIEAIQVEIDKLTTAEK